MNINVNGLIALAVALAIVVPACPVSAQPPVAATAQSCVEQADYSLDVGESMCWAPQPNRIFVVQGPKYMWGLRKVAAYIDRRVDRMTIITAPGVRCNEPQFLLHDNVYCVTVRKRVIESDQDVWGLFEPNEGRLDGTATSATITLESRHNRAYLPDRQHAAGHELMHVLGMQHHKADGRGWMQLNGAGLASPAWEATLPSRKEIIALQWWYEFDNTNSR